MTSQKRGSIDPFIAAPAPIGAVGKLDTSLKGRRPRLCTTSHLCVSFSIYNKFAGLPVLLI